MRAALARIEELNAELVLAQKNGKVGGRIPSLPPPHWVRNHESLAVCKPQSNTFDSGGNVMCINSVCRIFSFPMALSTDRVVPFFLPAASFPLAAVCAAAQTVRVCVCMRAWARTGDRIQ